MDNFNLFTPQDRQDVSYAACIGGSTAIGLAVGRFGLLPGILAGAAAGFAIGLLTCRKVSPAIERKLFSKSEKLTDQELLEVLKIVREETGIQSKSDAMYLLSHARHEMVTKGGKLKISGHACVPIRTAANQIISHRA